jgi:HEAT repeat protein
MKETKIDHGIVRRSKKDTIPLSKLRTYEVLKTVVDNPRRLDELIRMLEDKDRSARSLAAATLARLSESHPARLLRVIVSLREASKDDSAHVRWHIVYSLGKMGAQFPAQSRVFLNDLAVRLDDENRIVRIFAGRALGQVAARKPLIVEEFFQNHKREIPPSVARILRSSATNSKNAKRR